jgi:apolipoprotein N-acyltransferase
MPWLTFASTTAPGGISVVLPALGVAGILFFLLFLSQLFASKT